MSELAILIPFLSTIIMWLPLAKSRGWSILLSCSKFSPVSPLPTISCCCYCHHYYCCFLLKTQARWLPPSWGLRMQT
jgi:hypothetical protein